MKDREKNVNNNINLLITAISFRKRPNRLNGRKGSAEECIFDYIALHIKCRFDKNRLLQSEFLVFLPAGGGRQQANTYSVPSMSFEAILPSILKSY